MILGLDISTSITGVTVLNDKGEILHCEAIDTRNKNHFPTLFEKASKVRDYLGDIEYKYDIEAHLHREKPTDIPLWLLISKDAFNSRIFQRNSKLVLL